MARVFVAFYNFGRKKDDFDAMPPFYESFVSGLKDAGNEVLCFHQKTFTRSFDGVIPPEEERIIKRFDPQLCILFCNKFWDISNIVACPIIIYDVDSPLEYAGKEHLKKNVCRYKFVTNQSQGVKLLEDLFGVKKENVTLIPFFTEIHSDEKTESGTNICFLGTNWLWRGYDFVTEYVKKDPLFQDREYAKQIIEAFTKYPFSDTQGIKDRLGINQDRTTFEFADTHRAAIEISGLRRLKYLSNVADLGLEIRGAYWNIECMNYFPEVEMCCNGIQTFTKQENEEFYNSSRLSLNTKHIQAQNGFSFRVCDVMASNACLVTERCQDLEVLFPEVKIPMFETPAEERELCIKLLKNEDLRLEIVGRAHEAIDKNHRFCNVLDGLEFIADMSLRSGDFGSLTIYSDEDPISFQAVIKKYLSGYNDLDGDDIASILNSNSYGLSNNERSSTIIGSMSRVKRFAKKCFSFAKKIRNYIFSTSLFGCRKINAEKTNVYFFYLPVFTIRKTSKYKSFNLWLLDMPIYGAFALLKSIKGRIEHSSKFTPDGQWKVETKFGKKKLYASEQRYKDLFVTLDYLNQEAQCKDEELQKLLKAKNCCKKKVTKEQYEETKKNIEEYLEQFDATKLPVATGEIREHQLKLLELMKDVRDIIEAAGMHPLLTGGNLLGAVRHGGFIPWDDDVDFDMIRSEYDSALSVLLQKYKFCDTSKCVNWSDYFRTINAALASSNGEKVVAKTFSGIKVYSGNSVKTAISLDIFPIDCVSAKVSENAFKDFWMQAKTSLFKKCKNWGEAFDKMDDIIHNSGIFVPLGSRFYYGLGNHAFWNFKFSGLRRFDILYPYNKISFEGEEFYAPGDVYGFLTPIYGNYMKLPAKITISEHLKMADKFLKE